ncbi:hypothetical protein EYB25_003758 [Talaromyces marneffei]|uniref:Potassium channel tetramerisation-type BTB domain-containing protein n=1 Tax=Talaromyces marneffei (strain ATCC 18224 / CBS 334.59 / QM 7333) TaxID=441960 RepID=B6QBZ7_TALMQ|nr:uncharacterized protein EYB26_006234 [Talaromyces marneffei]EEA26520.1 conserved hypothetical protein [Talaromyces marneffei ATCC 18224]KAE8555210.1 hypothetical protein EYB25_003758 [Talaromyces marneffei]QGA18549.1 hypothetical protein EYB26_006234 [Talaromyces marneffei]
MPQSNNQAQQATPPTPTNNSTPQTFDKIPDVDPKTGLHEKSNAPTLKNRAESDLTVSHGILRQSSPSNANKPLEAGTQKCNLPPEKVFSIQLGSELFRLSGASIASDAPSYFSSFFEEQLQQTDQNGTIRTLYIDRDPVIFREICRHLQGYHVQPRTGEEFVRLYLDAQFYSLPRLIGQLFESDVFFQIGERDFRVPKDIFSAPGDSPNFFTLGFNIHFSAPPLMLPGLEKTGLLRPPSIIPPSVPNRSAEVFAQLIHILRGYPVDIKSESHRAELLRDCRYLHLRGVEQKLIPHEISYNPERDCSEIVIRLEDIRQSGVQFVADGSLVDGSTSSGWVYYARPFVDDKPCELIVEIGGQGTVIDLESMRAEFRGLTKARVSSLVQVIANKLNLPNKAPLGLMMMMAGGGSRNTTASPGRSPLSEDRPKVHLGSDADITIDGECYYVKPGGSTGFNLEKCSSATTPSNGISAGPPVKRKREEENGPSGSPPQGRWMVHNGQWRLRVQPDGFSSRLEIIFTAVKLEVFTNQRARNRKRGFLG